MVQVRALRSEPAWPGPLLSAYMSRTVVSKRSTLLRVVLIPCMELHRVANSLSAPAACRPHLGASVKDGKDTEDELQRKPERFAIDVNSLPDEEPFSWEHFGARALMYACVDPNRPLDPCPVLHLQHWCVLNRASAEQSRTSETRNCMC